MSNEISEDHYRKLQQDVSEARDEAERAKGALQQLMTQLPEEFGCSTLKEAKAKLQERQEARDKSKKKFERLLKDYESNWCDED